MLVNKKKIFNFLLIGLVGMPLVASANDLTISNKTTHNSTSRINNSPFCSDQVLGSDGVTRAGETKVIKDWQIKAACTGNYENCTAQVHMADGCQGPVISTVTFSVTQGVKAYSPPILGYRVKVLAPFSVMIEGGPLN